MSKLQEYFEKKRIKELNLPKLYIVKSDRNGVDPLKEVQVVDFKPHVATRYIGTSGITKNISRYIIGQLPYKVDIVDGEINCIDDGYGTGFGDLWVWRFFSSLSKEDALCYYNEEVERIFEKYGTKLIH